MSKKSIDKIQLFQNLKSEVDLQLQFAIDAANNTLEMATHEESKAENKYDTRGLEASYLARAQTERVVDLKALKFGIESIKIRNFTSSDPIAITALIQLNSKDKILWLLLLPQGGGQSVLHKSFQVKIITPDSPLGSQLVGKFLGDQVLIKNIEYDIVEIH